MNFISQFKPMEGVCARNGVYCGTYNGQDVVVKELPLRRSDMDGATVRKMVSREIWIQKEMTQKHPDVVVPFVDWVKCSDAGYVYILTERQGESLYDALKRPDFYSDTHKMVVMKTLYGIARCMAYLHAEFFMHRDLKPENILFRPHRSENPYPRICDFEFSRQFQTGETKGERTIDLGSTLYEAPEIIDGGEYGPEVDVFSYSLVMYACFAGNSTWEFENKVKAGNTAKIHDMIKDGKRYVRPENCNDAYWDLITQCWDPDPQKRPSFEKIMVQFRLNALRDPNKSKALREFAKEVGDDLDKFKEFKKKSHEEMMEKAAEKEAEMKTETDEQKLIKLEKEMNLYKRRAAFLAGTNQKMDSSLFLGQDDDIGSSALSDIESDEDVESQK